MSNLINTIEQEITAAIREDRLVLPTLPEAALRIREVAQDEDANVADLARTIGNDAAISARIIKVCNSPLLRASQPVENVKMAINRLGMSYSADLAVGLAMEQMFQATSDLIDRKMRENWERSTEVAGICHMLAQTRTRLSPAQAMLAGLTYRIGVLPILKFAEEKGMISDSFTLEETIENLYPSLGEQILRAWDFSEELCQVPAEHLNFNRDSNQVDLVDLVMVANLQTAKNPIPDLDISTIPAFAKLGITLDDDEDEDEDLSANMTAALAMLT